MTVNAILFFGQDSIEFATMDRALHSCFMAMLGFWDWEGMRKEKGLFRAFLWFFTFMVIMVMLLLNMLLAILMESYSNVKALAENEPSLAQQIQNLIRRAQQNRRGERVRLRDIWAALLKLEHGDDDAILTSTRRLYPRLLADIVPAIPKSQALRTLSTALEPGSARGRGAKGDAGVGGEKAGQHGPLRNMALIQAPLLREGNVHSTGRDGAAAFTRQTSQEDETALQNAIEAVKQISSERTLELADGVASVLGEEMQSLEKRQANQQKSMKDMDRHLAELRRLIFKLSQNCEEAGKLACRLESGCSGTAPADLQPSIAPAPAAFEVQQQDTVLKLGLRSR
eukprot:CAMPEP_0175450498 /NCGR_PEP_ID=MMETSP0095-20121207/62401_1 /TAXON_ID=311494 /ORGANISM="Alexandrium monilatum, Strain CCMP3105" /LENGTH=340 /DNA_ID=CAMNT_0016750973 /DNA_START=1 /DNA_END=1021 /DNA_ORIENTATION=-